MNEQMINMDIQKFEDESKGTARAIENGITAGEMTYSIPQADFIIIDHTEVEPEFKSKGLGKLLLCEIVKMAREKGLKILPLCPFANAMFKKLEDIRDVLK